MITHWSRRLKALGACKDAVDWAKKQPSFPEAWASCERGDWMLWLAGTMCDKPDWPTRQELVLVACDCAELSLKYVKKGEDRPRVAIETARKWAKGEATIQEVREARRATDAAYAAAGAATAAAYAADAVAYATAAAYAADAAADAAAATRTGTLKKCAILVRKSLTVPEVL